MEQISFVYMTNTKTFQQRKKKKKSTVDVGKTTWLKIFFKQKKYDNNSTVSKVASRHFFRRS